VDDTGSHNIWKQAVVKATTTLAIDELWRKHACVMSKLTFRVKPSRAVIARVAILKDDLVLVPITQTMSFYADGARAPVRMLAIDGAEYDHMGNAGTRPTRMLLHIWPQTVIAPSVSDVATAREHHVVPFADVATTSEPREINVELAWEGVTVCGKVLTVPVLKAVRDVLADEELKVGGTAVVAAPRVVPTAPAASSGAPPKRAKR
jgi:hypothetical protein